MIFPVITLEPRSGDSLVELVEIEMKFLAVYSAA